MNPDKISYLHWNLANTYHTMNIGQIYPQVTCISTHCIDVDTLSHGEGDRCGNWYGTTLNTDTITLKVILYPSSALSFIIMNTKYENITSYLYIIPSTYSQQEPKVGWPETRKPLRILT